MPPDFSGRWKPVCNDGFADILKKIGFNTVKIRAAVPADQLVKQDLDTGEIECTTVVIIMWVNFSRVSKFTIGEDFDDTDPVGNVWNCTSRWEDDTIVVNAECTKKNFKHVITRKFVGNQMWVIMELTCGDGEYIKAVRKFDRKQ